jgi:hypothetical protein
MTLNKVGRSKAAKARIVSTRTHYVVDVIGYTWEGYVGTYTYDFSTLPTQYQITLKAGDFESILDYQTREEKVIYYTDGRRLIHKTIDAWQKPDSEEKFLDSQGN